MNESWRADARCATIGPAIFFPRPEKAHADTLEARAACDHCPVRRQCLDYALRLEAGQSVARRAGIYGGATPAQRHRFEQQTREVPA